MNHTPPPFGSLWQVQNTGMVALWRSHECKIIDRWFKPDTVFLVLDKMTYDYTDFYNTATSIYVTYRVLTLEGKIGYVKSSHFPSERLARLS